MISRCKHDIISEFSHTFPSLLKDTASYNTPNISELMGTGLLVCILAAWEGYHDGMNSKSSLLRDELNPNKRDAQTEVRVIGRFCEEGDNTLDGEMIARLLIRDIYFKLLASDQGNESVVELVKPLSWNRRLYGPPLPDISMFL